MAAAVGACGNSGSGSGTEVATLPAAPPGAFKPERSREARDVAAVVRKNERESGEVRSVGCARITPDPGYLDWDCRVDFARGPTMRCRTPAPNRYGVIEVLNCSRGR